MNLKNMTAVLMMFLALSFNVRASQSFEEFEEDKRPTFVNPREISETYTENPIENLQNRVVSKLGAENKKINICQLNSENIILKKKVLKKIQDFFFETKEHDEDASFIFNLAYKLYRDFDNLPRQQFQQKAREYFSRQFPTRSISFLEKLGGDQLGNRIVVELAEGQQITYHAKTHRGGLKSQHSSSSQPVDLKELLIYKVLQFSGLGSESHFFYDDISNFYIATKDAGYDEATRTQKEFCTYDTLKNQIDASEFLSNAVVVKGFIKADILSRLLILSDVLNNFGNIGFIREREGLLGFKIIDFNPPVTREYHNPRIFEDWCSGNNQYNYSDQTILSILKKENKEHKVLEAQESLRELENFPRWVDESRDYVT